MRYFKASPSCKEKILAWDKKDFPTFAASMNQEEIRSMVKQLYDECFYPHFEHKTPEGIVYDYILLLAYEAECAANESEAERVYDILFAI